MTTMTTTLLCEGDNIVVIVVVVVVSRARALAGEQVIAATHHIRKYPAEGTGKDMGADMPYPYPYRTVP